MKTLISYLSLIFLLFSFSSSNVNAAIVAPNVFTADPANSWAYSELNPSGIVQPASFFTSNPNDFAAASFQGFVNYDPALLTRATSPIAGWTGGFTTSDQFSFQVFTTFVLSDFDQTLSLITAGDDGTSAFIDGLFIGGGGFGVVTNFNLALQAGIAKKLEIVTYNSGGPWATGISVDTGTGLLSTNKIEDLNGVSIHATGDFASVPEPSTLILLSLGLVALGIRKTKR